MKWLLSETPSHSKMKPFWIQDLCICKNSYWLLFSGMLSSTCKSALLNDDFSILSVCYGSHWCLVFFFSYIDPTLELIYQQEIVILHLRINFFAQVAQKMQIFRWIKLVTLTIWSCQWFCVKNISAIKKKIFGLPRISDHLPLIIHRHWFRVVR